MPNYAAFVDWYERNLGDGVRPGTWVALDDNLTIVDQDEDSNRLLERLEQTQPNPSILRIVYAFPSEWI